mmetsp:Transcript_19051/g.31875  ORF Transcript_19051/g.31875 Transcript_19051/m.31875 type:complete len:236 (+) Transcript_19051:2330-3037(+)
MMILLFGCLLFLAFTGSLGFQYGSSLQPVGVRGRMPATLSMMGDKEAEKEEQWRIQQEKLAQRKNKVGMQKYFEGVEEGRKQRSAKAKRTLWSKSMDKVDPLEKWKAARDRGDVKKIGYDPAPAKSESKLGFNLVVPVNPIGISQYDEGERFDLRLPYAERGYEDPDADVMGKFANLFKSKTKSKEVTSSQSAKATATSSVKKNAAKASRTAPVGNKNGSDDKNNKKKKTNFFGW